MDKEKKTTIVAYEKYGQDDIWEYHLQNGLFERKRREKDCAKRGTSLMGVFKSIFLPQGFPDSVSEDYLQYQFWDTLQAFSSSLSGTLATQASLKGVGVGNQEATVAAATITWLLKDGTGMLGRIIFAWLKGNKLDSEAKKWRLFADVLNDIAMFMEILAPNFPTFFLLIVCTAGIFKAVVGVAGGATRAALTVHQARRENMADISAKDGSQETLVNLAGLLISLILIPLVTDNPLLTIFLFCLFTILHLFANYKAVRSVVMDTLNEARLEIVLHHYLKNGQVLSPLEANYIEPVFIELKKTVPINLGVKLGQFVQSQEELNLALKNNYTPYLIGVKSGSVCVCLGPEASVCDEIRAMCQAFCLRSVLKPKTPLEGLLKQLAVAEKSGYWELVCESHKIMDQIFQPFLQGKLQVCEVLLGSVSENNPYNYCEHFLGLKLSGWQTTRTLLDWEEWRVEWKIKTT